MVTSSPFPTCSSPSQLVSIDAGLKSSVKKEKINKKEDVKKRLATNKNLNSGPTYNCIYFQHFPYVEE